MKPQEQLWEMVVEAARQGRESGDRWDHGYREGLLTAYAVMTGCGYEWAKGFLISELRASGRERRHAGNTTN